MEFPPSRSYTDFSWPCRCSARWTLQAAQRSRLFDLDVRHDLADTRHGHNVLWTLTIAYLPQRLVDLLTTVQATPWLFLMDSIALLIVLLNSRGTACASDFGASPAADRGRHGISQLHLGIVLLIAMAIGALTPPAGAGFYISCAVLGTTVERSSKAMAYFIMLCIGVVLVGLVPWSTIALPRAFGLIILSTRSSATRSRGNFDTELRAISLLRVDLQLKAKGGQPPRLHTLAVGLTACPNS